MTISSINSNLAALLAQTNIGTATNATDNDVSALSSGNRIVNASTDVAALAAGTGLQSQVNVLTSSIAVAAQGSSLLQVADGGLSQIQAILQRQQAITTSAESGSLSSTQLGFLNQEFQALTTEINNIANQTNFNGVSLLNGNIASGTALNTNTTTGSTSGPISVSIGTIGSVVSGDTFTLKIAGQATQTFTFGTNVGIGTGGVNTAADDAQTASNLAAAINNSGLSQLSDVRVVANGNVLSAYYTGAAAGSGNIPQIISGTNDATNVTGTGTATFAAGTAVATISAGDINAGDSIVVGTHTISFVASGAVAADGQVNIGTTASLATATGFANLATYLNSVAGTTGFSDLAGINFTATTASGSSVLYAAYEGNGATPPTLTTSYTSSAAITFTGVTNQNVSGSTSVLSIASEADLSDGQSSFVIGGVTVGFLSGSSSGLSGITNPYVDDTGTLSTTLANLASYLNSVSTSLTGAYEGLTFASDGHNIYAVNDTGANVSLGATTFSNAAPTAGITNPGTTSVPTSSSAVFLGATINDFAAGNTIVSNGHTITFVTSGGTTSNGEINIGTNISTTLANIASYFNANASALGDNGLTFTSTASNISAYNATGSAISADTFTINAGKPQDVTAAAASTALLAGTTVGTFGGTGSIVAGDSIVVAGQTFSFIAGASTGSSVHVGSNLSTTLANLVTQINANTTIAGDDLTFSSNATSIYAQNNVGGLSSTVSTGSFTGLGAPTFTGSTNIQIAADSVVGLGAGTTSAVGTPSGSLLVSDTGSTVINYGNAINLSLVANNSSFVGAFGGTGTIGAITANYVNTGTTSTSGAQFSVTVGNDTYTTNTIQNSALTSATAPVTLTFTGSNNVTSAAEGGSFTITLQPQATDITSQNGADQLATGINAALSSVSAYQNRNVLSFNNNYSATVGGVTTATLQGASLSFNSGDFTSPIISSVSVSAPSTGSTDATISAVVNGDTYSTISGIGDTFGANNEIVLVNQSNPNQTLTLTLGSAGSATLSSASDASAFQTALYNALGLNNGTAGGLNFQVGTSSTDTLGVSLSSATSSALGIANADVKTTADAASAATAVAAALNTVTALRATTGALEETFNFASSALQAASQNEGAAESNLLDTDVASTSTTFATNQVQLQAGIAVLAQANQLQQNLLKLVS